MIPIGIDTSFLVAVESATHERAFDCRELLDRLLADEELFALNPDVLSEFIHVVTDSKRIADSLTMNTALERAKYWWSNDDVAPLFPSDDAVELFWEWMSQYRLGRKRVRDTMLAASYFSVGVTRLVTLNAKDFEVFDCFEIIQPPLAAPPA